MPTKLVKGVPLSTETTTDVINFDAYQHAHKAALCARDFKGFLERGGMIGWGIVPVSGELLEKESLKRRNKMSFYSRWKPRRKTAFLPSRNSI